MRGGRLSATLLAGTSLAMLAGAAPAQGAAHKHHKPAIALGGVSASQNAILHSGRIKVRVGAGGASSRIRLFGSVRGYGKHAVPIVATKIRELKVRRGHPRKVSLRLSRAGRNALLGCARRKVVVTAAPIVRSAGKPGHRTRRARTLKRDRCGRGGSGGGGKAGDAIGGPPHGQPVNFTPQNPDRCDWIDGADCMLPWPNDLFTTPDSTTDTKLRLNLNILSVPKNVEGKPIDPTPFNRNDGFSPGSLITTKVPGLETKAAFDKSGIVPIDDMAQAFRPDQPVVLIDAKTLARHLVWAEVDANPPTPADVTLIIRPGKNLQEGHRYIVALRRLKDANGKTLQPSTGFRVYRDGNPTKSSAVEARRPHFESIFNTLAQAGIDRDDLYRAWDFTVASERNLSERMLSIRDDAFKQLGDTNLADLKVQGDPPQWTAHKVAQSDSDLAYTVEGSYTVPCYLNAPGCPSGSEFAYDPTKTNGPPIRIPNNTMTARFTCIVPKVAVANGNARPSLYGHGLLGSRGEVMQSQAKHMVQEHDFVYCATDWIGMACADLPDIPGSADDIQNEVATLFNNVAMGITPNPPNCDYQTVLGIEHDLSNFPKLADRVQQGMLNFLYLARLMSNPKGFNSSPLFQTAAGKPMLDTTQAYYDGNSQGGIIGGALAAVMPDSNRATLGVLGMNYSTLLQRSTDFGTGQPPDPTNPGLPEYSYGLYTSYPNRLQRPMILSLMQQLWDRAEADGYALHMTNDPYPNTPPTTYCSRAASATTRWPRWRPRPRRARSAPTLASHGPTPGATWTRATRSTACRRSPATRSTDRPSRSGTSARRA